MAEKAILRDKSVMKKKPLTYAQIAYFRVRGIRFALYLTPREREEGQMTYQNDGMYCNPDMFEYLCEIANLLYARTLYGSGSRVFILSPDEIPMFPCCTFMECSSNLIHVCTFQEIPKANSSIPTEIQRPYLTPEEIREILARESKIKDQLESVQRAINSKMLEHSVTSETEGSDANESLEKEPLYQVSASLQSFVVPNQQVSSEKSESSSVSEDVKKGLNDMDARANAFFTKAEISNTSEKEPMAKSSFKVPSTSVKPNVLKPIPIVAKASLPSPSISLPKTDKQVSSSKSTAVSSATPARTTTKTFRVIQKVPNTCPRPTVGKSPAVVNESLSAVKLRITSHISAKSTQAKVVNVKSRGKKKHVPQPMETDAKEVVTPRRKKVTKKAKFHEGKILNVDSKSTVKKNDSAKETEMNTDNLTASSAAEQLNKLAISVSKEKRTVKKKAEQSERRREEATTTSNDLYQDMSSDEVVVDKVDADQSVHDLSRDLVDMSIGSNCSQNEDFPEGDQGEGAPQNGNNLRISHTSQTVTNEKGDESEEDIIVITKIEPPKKSILKKEHQVEMPTSSNSLKTTKAASSAENDAVKSPGQNKTKEELWIGRKLSDDKESENHYHSDVVSEMDIRTGNLKHLRIFMPDGCKVAAVKRSPHLAKMLFGVTEEKFFQKYPKQLPHNARSCAKYRLLHFEITNRRKNLLRQLPTAQMITDLTGHKPAEPTNSYAPHSRFLSVAGQLRSNYYKCVRLGFGIYHETMALEELVVTSLIMLDVNSEVETSLRSTIQTRPSSTVSINPTVKMLHNSASRLVRTFLNLMLKTRIPRARLTPHQYVKFYFRILKKVDKALPTKQLEYKPYTFTMTDRGRYRSKFDGTMVAQDFQGDTLDNMLFESPLVNGGVLQLKADPRTGIADEESSHRKWLAETRREAGLESGSEMWNLELPEDHVKDLTTAAAEGNDSEYDYNFEKERIDRDKRLEIKREGLDRLLTEMTKDPVHEGICGRINRKPAILRSHLPEYVKQQKILHAQGTLPDEKDQKPQENEIKTVPVKVEKTEVNPEEKEVNTSSSEKDCSFPSPLHSSTPLREKGNNEESEEDKLARRRLAFYLQEAMLHNSQDDPTYDPELDAASSEDSGEDLTEYSEDSLHESDCDIPSHQYQISPDRKNVKMEVDETEGYEDNGLNEEGNYIQDEIPPKLMKQIMKDQIKEEVRRQRRIESQIKIENEAKTRCETDEGGAKLIGKKKMKSYDENQPTCTKYLPQIKCKIVKSDKAEGDYMVKKEESESDEFQSEQSESEDEKEVGEDSQVTKRKRTDSSVSVTEHNRRKQLRTLKQKKEDAAIERERQQNLPPLSRKQVMLKEYLDKHNLTAGEVAYVEAHQKFEKFKEMTVEKKQTLSQIDNVVGSESAESESDSMEDEVFYDDNEVSVDEDEIDQKQESRKQRNQLDRKARQKYEKERAQEVEEDQMRTLLSMDPRDEGNTKSRIKPYSKEYLEQLDRDHAKKGTEIPLKPKKKGKSKKEAKNKDEDDIEDHIKTTGRNHAISSSSLHKNATSKKSTEKSYKEPEDQGMIYDGEESLYDSEPEIPMEEVESVEEESPARINTVKSKKQGQKMKSLQAPRPTNHSEKHWSEAEKWAWLEIHEDETSKCEKHFRRWMVFSRKMAERGLSRDNHQCRKQLDQMKKVYDDLTKQSGRSGKFTELEKKIIGVMGFKKHKKADYVGASTGPVMRISKVKRLQNAKDAKVRALRKKAIKCVKTKTKKELMAAQAAMESDSDLEDSEISSSTDDDEPHVPDYVPRTQKKGKSTLEDNAHETLHVTKKFLTEFIEAKDIMRAKERKLQRERKKNKKKKNTK